jgi:hypothetical protein
MKGGQGRQGDTEAATGTGAPPKAGNDAPGVVLAQKHEPPANQPSTQPPNGNPVTFQHLPLHLQTLVLAWASAPLNTCKAAALIPADSSLTALWLMRSNKRQPLLVAAKHQLWDACQAILDSGTPVLTPAVIAALQKAAAAGQEQLVAKLVAAGGEKLLEKSDNSWEERSAGLKKAWSLAAGGGHHRVCHLLAELVPELHKEEPPPVAGIRQAAANGHIEEVCSLLDSWNQLHPTRKEGLAELQVWAVKHNTTHCLSCRGCLCSSDHGSTILQCALRFCCPRVICPEVFRG